MQQYNPWPICLANTVPITKLQDNFMLDVVIHCLLVLINYFPQIYLVVKTIITLRQPMSSKTLILTWISYISFVFASKHLCKTWKLQINMSNWVQTLGSGIILLIPPVVYDKFIQLIISIRSNLLKIHPRTVYTKMKHRSAMKSIQKSIKSINKYIKLLTDQERKQIKDQILLTIFDEQPKNYSQEGVQCQIILIKPTQTKPIKTIDIKNTTTLIKTNSKIQTPIGRISQPEIITKKEVIIQKKQQYIKKEQPKRNFLTDRTPVVSGGIQRYYATNRTPITQSLTLKRSDVMISQQTPPKYTRTATIPVVDIKSSINSFKKKTTQKSELSMQMSVYSDLLDDQQQTVQSKNIKKQVSSPPSKPIKKMISKVQIYMQSVVEPSKLQKFYLCLYQGDQIQIQTLTNTVLQVIILLKLIQSSNGYFEAKGYSNIAGMCNKKFKFKDDYSAFNKYIQK